MLNTYPRRRSPFPALPERFIPTPAHRSHQTRKRLTPAFSPKIGLEHGRRLAGKIRSQMQIYESMFQHTSKLDWPSVRSIAREYASTIERLTPDLYEEMRGIAEGAGLVDVLDVVALNCRSEIALGLFSDGCTSLGWRMRREGEGEVVLAQNWDWVESVKKNLVMMSIETGGLPKVFMVTEVCALFVCLVSMSVTLEWRALLLFYSYILFGSF